jgi:hypothetical protein
VLQVSDELAVRLQPITNVNADEVARFLHEELNPHVKLESWRSLLNPPWLDNSPNRGFLLRAGDRVVGAYCAVYADRGSDDPGLRTCNLAAFCVISEYRPHGLLLIRALLRQKGYVFTDLSPSGNVVAMNERLGFRRLDTRTKLVVNLPRARRRRVAVSSDPDDVARIVRGRDARVFRDHREAPAAIHVVVTRGDTYAYLIVRRERRKRMPLFAAPLHVAGDTALLESEWAAVRSHLLLTHGLVGTLAEHRILGFAKGFGFDLKSPRVKMYRGDIDASNVDYLYSELTLVNW